MVLMPQEPKKKFNWKKVLLIIVIVAVIAGLFTAALYWYAASNTPGQSPDLTKKTTATSSAKKSATPSSELKKTEVDKTEGWQTFSSTEISFKYPSGWVKVNDLDNSSEADAKAGKIWEKMLGFQKTSGKDMSGAISVNTANNPSGLTLKNFVAAKQSTLFIGKEVQASSDLEIDGVETLKLVYPASPQAYGMVSYVVAFDKKIYEFEYTVVTGISNPVPASEYETILSTVKFL